HPITTPVPYTTLFRSWKSGNEEAAYSAPLVATLAGVKQIVYLSGDSLAGYALANGKILWRVPLKTDAKRHACSPVIVGDTITVRSEEHTSELQSPDHL